MISLLFPLLDFLSGAKLRNQHDSVHRRSCPKPGVRYFWGISSISMMEEKHKVALMKSITLFLSLFLLVDEPYLSSGKKTVHEDNIPFTDDFGPITIPNDAAFVMGDNRLNSYDSRSVGPVPIAQVIGKAAKKLAEKR